MATYVLVHGAWGGAYVFEHVRPRLHEAGHDVFTPALTGQGERVHLVGPHVSLDTHIEDVVNVVLYWDLRNIILLGSSYGGMVVTGTTERIADRIAHLAYLDAFVPSDGECLDELAGFVRTDGLGDPWLLEPRSPARTQVGVDPQLSIARRTPQPLKTFTTPVRLSRSVESHPFKRTYIKATGVARPDPPDHFWRAADHAKESPLWEYREIAEDHASTASRPDRLVEILLGLA